MHIYIRKEKTVNKVTRDYHTFLQYIRPKHSRGHTFSMADVGYMLKGLLTQTF